jgi:hypothetical protein
MLMPYLEKLRDTHWGWWTEHLCLAAVSAIAMIAIVA